MRPAQVAVPRVRRSQSGCGGAFRPAAPPRDLRPGSQLPQGRGERCHNRSRPALSRHGAWPIPTLENEAFELQETNKSPITVATADMNNSTMARITRLVPPRATALVTACQKLAKDALPPVLKAFVDRVDDSFFELANKADSSQRQQTYFDAMRELRLKRPQLEREFFETLDAQVEQALNAPQRKRTVAALEAQAELSLVGVDDVEEDLAVTNLVESLQTRAKQELFALDQRIGHLLSDPTLSADTNPFGPRALGRALRALADGLQTGLEVKITLLKLFDRHAATGVVEMWRAMNELLVQAGVLPSLHAAYARGGGAPRTRVIIETTDGTAEAAGNDVFGTLQKLMQSGPGALHAALGIGGPAGIAGTGLAPGAMGGIGGVAGGGVLSGGIGGGGIGGGGIAGGGIAGGGIAGGGTGGTGIGGAGAPAGFAAGGFPGVDGGLLDAAAGGCAVALPTMALISNLT
ncbi:MAG: DUF1631 family protein, partial [Gammaproteobacteria bacterium]